MFVFPRGTLVNRVIPKSKILANTRASTRLKDLLTSEIQQIRWLAKLSPATTNLKSSPHVPEIQVFQIQLKGPDITPDLLDLLDKAIPHPLFHLLLSPSDQQAWSAAHKRPSDSDPSKWVTGPRFTSPFKIPPSSFPPLPTAPDLDHLYASLFAPLLPLTPKSAEPLPYLIARCQHHQSLDRQIKQLTSKVNRERQFKRRITLNQELNRLHAELSKLS